MNFCRIACLYGVLAAALILPDAVRAQSTAAHRDSVLIAYDLTPGESVTYRVVTNDTIHFGNDPRSLRTAERAQLVTYTCVGRLEEGFLMRLSASDYAAQERLDTLPPVVRTEHPWTGRTFLFSMASDGRRLVLYSSADTPGVGPVGPFQPLLFPPLGDSTAWIGQAAIFRFKHWMIDNAIPPSPWDGSIFRVVEGFYDTLGVRTMELSMEELADVSYEPEGGTTTIARINGTAIHYFAPHAGVMISGEIHTELRLDIRTPDGRTLPGKQRITVRYQLVGNQMPTEG
jgi:hypothetical protein